MRAKKKKGCPKMKSTQAVLGPSQTPWIYPSIHLEKKRRKKVPDRAPG
jgi:hypothetical protein